MKSFIAIALLATAVSADITCDDCKEFGGAMQNYLMSEASLLEQTTILIATLCPEAPDAAACEAGLTEYWSQIGMAMYPVFLEPTAVCGELGVCKKSVVAVPTCDECIGSVVLVSDVIKSEAKIADIVAFLQDYWCPSLGSDTCADNVSELMPLAMPVLAGVLTDKSEEYCCTLSPSGVCC